MTERPGEAVRLDATRRARAPQLDAAAAEALAVVTLLTTGDDRDVERAGRIIDELLTGPPGADRLIHGLTSVSATLLVLLEFYGGLGLDDALREAGTLIAQASLPL